MAELKVGTKLFHKNSTGIVRECEIIKIHVIEGTEKIYVKFFEKIKSKGENEKDIFEFNNRSFGKFLFFEKEDAQLSIEELATMLDYIECGNNEICDIVKKREEELKNKEKQLELRKKEQEIRTKSITELLEEHQINHLVYFTRTENLKSILENGIVPESKQIENGICATKNNCKKRYEFQIEGNGYSVEFPNYKILTLLREGGNPQNRYVILRLDAKALLVDTLGKHVYCKDNALTSEVKYGGFTLKELLNMPVYRRDPFEELFSDRYFKEGYMYDDEYQKEIDNKREDLNIPAHFTTNPQAEVVILDIVSPKYIKQVVFENESDRQEWLKHNSEFRNSSVNFVIDESLFGPRSDYLFWQ